MDVGARGGAELIATEATQTLAVEVAESLLAVGVDRAERRHRDLVLSLPRIGVLLEHGVAAAVGRGAQLKTARDRPLANHLLGRPVHAVDRGPDADLPRRGRAI